MAQASDHAPSPSHVRSMRYGLRRGHDHDDEFANFSFTPPRPRGRFRSFSRNANKYQNLASLSQSKECLSSGSNTNLASFGSSQNLTQLDPVKRMNLQEDARSRRISAEIMKHRLYESVITSPRRRRLSVRADYMASRPTDEILEMQNFQYTSRMVQSLPVTPAHSQNVTPIQSPTSSRRFFFGFFSRGTTPEEDDRCLRPAPPTNQDSWKGLASIFKPSPRCIPVARAPSITDMREDNEDIENRLQDPNEPGVYVENEGEVYMNTPPRVRPGKNGPCPVYEKDLNPVQSEDM